MIEHHLGIYATHHHFTSLVESIIGTDDVVVINKKGKPVAIIIDVDELASLRSQVKGSTV